MLHINTIDSHTKQNYTLYLADILGAFSPATVFKFETFALEDFFLAAP